jgi:transaldolase
VGDMKPLKIKVFADGADIQEMVQAYRQRKVQGFTTNPTLMRKAGVADYEVFARSVLQEITELPISFEVFSDELPEMLRQARKISQWGKNVYVKIPVTNTRGESTASIIRELAGEGIRLNITAILTTEQVRTVVDSLDAQTPAVVSVFAGRIADTGRDPIPLMSESLEMVKTKPHAELLWASPRELLNIIQADCLGCHIITVTPELLKKLSMVGKDLAQLSLETVQMFYNDARAAAYSV